MKHILLTLEAGSREEEALLLEAIPSLTESARNPSNKEEPMMISGSLSIAP